MTSDSPAQSDVSAVRADGWITPGRFALLLAGLIAVCFPQVLAGLETFFIRDYGGFGYPLAFYHREAFWRGQVPLWNPLNDCGLPFLAQWNTLTLYPLALIYLLLPLPWSLGVFCLAHLFLAGLGMYFLAHYWTRNRLAAAMAGTMFAFNGLTWHSLMWPNNIAGLGWMPWVLLAVEHAYREGGRRRLALAAFAGAMQMLTGAPEVILLTWCAAGSLWLAHFFAGETPRRQLLGRMVLVLVLVTGLAAAQLLPFLDLLAHSQRDTGFGDAQWAMPGTGWANYFVPLFHLQLSSGGPGGLYSQFGQYWTSSYYLGIGTVALALLAVWRVRDRRTWVLLILAAFSLALAMGNNGFVHAWLKHIFPQLGFMRFPIKFVVLTTLVVPLLAAQGIAWCQNVPAEKWPAERRRMAALAAGTLGLIALIAWFASRNAGPIAGPAAAYDVPGTLRNAATRALFLTAIIGGLLILRTLKVPKRQKMACVLLVLLCWFDVYTHSSQLSPTVALKVFQPDDIRQYLGWTNQFTTGEFRTMPTPTSLLKMQFSYATKPEDDVYGRRLSLMADYNLLDHLPKVDGFYSLYLREADAVTVWLYTVTNGLSPLKDFLGVSQISHPANIGEWLPRDTAMPLITAGQAPVFMDDSTAFHTVIREDFDPRNVVYLPPAAGGFVSAQRNLRARVLASHFSPQLLTAEVETVEPAMVVIAQADYHCWRAYVDGQPAHLWRANYAYQALEVPTGQHEVKLVYEDRAFHWGLVISLATLAGCLVAWFGGRKKSSLAEARQ